MDQPYLPYHPIHYSSLAVHRHAELASIERSRLLWEESLRINERRTLEEIETNRELLLYAQEKEADERELRLQRFMDQSREQSLREMDELRRRVLQEQVDYQDYLRKMELERSYHRGAAFPIN